MSFDLPKSAIDQLKGFIALCRTKPEMLHHQDLQFFKDYLESLGADLPPAPEPQKAATPPKEEEMPKEEAKKTPEEDPEDVEMSSEESDVELDMEGVMETADDDEPHEMGDTNKKEMTDEEMDKFDEKRSEFFFPS